MKIIIDAFGGDNSPSEIIKATVESLKEIDDLEVIIIGDLEIIKNILSNYSYDESRIEIVHAQEVISNDDPPILAIRKKTNSTIVVGLKLLSSQKDIGAFISAGSTGAVLTGAVLLLKRLPSVLRPALAPILPTPNSGSVILIDCGANVECRPEMLVQFAVMGKVYSNTIFGIKSPRIGLLSNGAESSKGTDLVLQTHKLLTEDDKINFIGNAEGRDILSGDFDVVVSDGYTGNIALKACEGTANLIFSLLKNGIESGGFREKLGYILLKKVFKNLKDTTDYNKKGGAVLLGLDSLVIKVHGSCKSDSFKASIHQSVKYIREDLVGKLRKSLEEFSDERIKDILD